MNMLPTAICDRLFQRSEIYRAMGYGDVTPDENVCSVVERLCKEAHAVVKPSFHYELFPCAVEAEAISLGDVRLDVGRTIASLLRRSESAVLFVATVGDEFQQWLDGVNNSGEILDMFVADAIGSALVESVGDYMERVLDGELESERATLKHTNRFSPGYCGWNIEQQKILFAQLPEGVCGVELNANSLMYPIKSISGVIGVGESVSTKMYGCSICKRIDCYMRKKSSSSKV